LELGAVITVETFRELPPPSQNVGRLFYVESDGLYWSVGDSWLPIVRTSLDLIWAWGLNSSGQLGNNTLNNTSSPVAVLGSADWCQVGCGWDHSLAIESNGTAWAWGSGANGRLGNGISSNRTSPVSVIGGFTNWCQISGAQNSTLAIRADGTAWGWGANNNGQLGDGTASGRLSPVPVVGGFTDWCQISAGSGHGVAVRMNGTAWSWGAGANGRLGDGTTTTKSSPVLVAGGFTDWCQVAAGGTHSLGIRSNGTAWAWGNNAEGRLGDNTVTQRNAPVSVVGGFTDWCQVSAGCHSIGVRQNGTVWAWGAGALGRLGTGNTTNRSSPTLVIGGFTDWCQASAGNSHSLGVRQNGTAWAWGSNVCGRLGDGTVTARSSPVSVIGGFADWCMVSAGDTHSLAIRRQAI